MINDKCFWSKKEIQGYRKCPKGKGIQRREILSTLEYTSQDIGRK